MPMCYKLDDHSSQLLPLYLNIQLVRLLFSVLHNKPGCIMAHTEMSINVYHLQEKWLHKYNMKIPVFISGCYSSKGKNYSYNYK